MQLSEKQIEACEHMQKAGFKGIIWHKPGTGKTRIALRCAQLSGCKRVYVVCPKKASFSWQDEITALGFMIPYIILSSDSFWKMLDESADFRNMMLIVDEHYYFANPNSTRSKFLRRFSMNFPYRLGLSGTIQPASDNITLWGQLSALHLEKVVAQNATAFRSEYQESVFTKWGRSHKNKIGSIDAIIKKIASIVHVYFPDNAHRNIREQIVKCNLTKEQTNAIISIRKTYQLKIPNSSVVLDYKTAMEILFTVSKISNGWIKDEEGNRTDFKSDKLDRLLAILETLSSAGSRAVVWCNFREDVAFLQEHLPYKTLRFIGGEDFDSVAWSSSKYPFTIATAASGASVNYFGDVEYGIYYSLPLKLTDFIQSKARHERKNSNHGGAFYYYLLSKLPTMDEHVLNLLKENNTNEQEIICKLARCFLT